MTNDFSRIFLHPWLTSFAYNSEIPCTTKSRQPVMIKGFFRFVFKNLFCSILFLIRPVSKMNGMVILLIALNAKIMLMQKARYKMKSNRDKKLCCVSGI
jgi:hypothetical protein